MLYHRVLCAWKRCRALRFYLESLVKVSFFLLKYWNGGGIQKALLFQPNSNSQTAREQFKSLRTPKWFLIAVYHAWSVVELVSQFSPACLLGCIIVWTRYWKCNRGMKKKYFVLIEKASYWLIFENWIFILPSFAEPCNYAFENSQPNISHWKIKTFYQKNPNAFLFIHLFQNFLDTFPCSCFDFRYIIFSNCGLYGTNVKELPSRLNWHL